MDLGLAVITKPVLRNLIRVHLCWKVGISDGLPMELFVLAQLFKFWVPELKLIGLVRAWVRSIVVHRHLPRVIIIIISVNFLMALFVVEVPVLFAGVRRLPPLLLDPNLRTLKTGKDRLNGRSEIPRISA